MSGFYSQKYFQQARQVLAGGLCGYGEGEDCLNSRIIVQRAAGSRIVDVDGNEYIDYDMNAGFNILGHANRNVVLALKKHAERGIHLATPSRAEIGLAQFIADHVPSIDRVRFFGSAAQAVSGALELARSVMKRRRIAGFEGAAYGFDGLRAGISAVPQTARGSDLPLILPFNDPQALKRTFKKYHRQIAGAVLEPVMFHTGIIRPDREFLDVLKDTCRRYGVMLILDESATGFRVFPGCLQSEFGIEPDLTCLGGVIGGGFSIGAYGGRDDLMQRCSFSTETCRTQAFCPNPVILKAGFMTLRLLNQGFFNALNRKAQKFSQNMNDFFAGRGLDVHLDHFYSVMNFRFPRKSNHAHQESSEDSGKLCYACMRQYLLERGIYFPLKESDPFFLSGKHSRKELAFLEDVLKEFFK